MYNNEFYKQRKIKFEPRIILNHTINGSTVAELGKT